MPLPALLLAAVTQAAPPGPSPLHVEGAHLLDAKGATVQLRGVNYSGFEFAAIQGWAGEDPSGAQAGQRGGPNWQALREWKANAIRLPLNEASWLGHRCLDRAGKQRDPDPARRYRAAVKRAVSEAHATGLYVILDLHWTAPGASCPLGQSQMADADHAPAFWRSVATAFKRDRAVLFELFNEPFFDFGFDGENAWAAMMREGGTFGGLAYTAPDGSRTLSPHPWRSASYQTLIDAVRSAGARNIVLVGSMSYDQDFSGWLSHRPNDPLGQLAAAWHPYPAFGTAWGTPAHAQPNFATRVYDDLERILEAGIPVIATETGDRNTAGTKEAPLVASVTRWADAHGVGVLGFGWDVWSAPDNVLIRDADGTPTDGYGRAFYDWLHAH